MELIDLTELQQVLQDLANDIRDNYKEHLQFNDRYTEKGVPTGYSEKLIDSVKTEVVVGDNAYEVTMTLNDYWKYVEDDTKPHFPPPDAILRWIEVKPVIPRPGSNGKIPTPKQLAYLICRKISIEGTTGTHDLAKTKEDILPWWREQISQALGHDMENYIRKVVRE